MRIEYPNGVMEIELEMFFPASQTDARKLKKLVGCSFHPEEYRAGIERYIQERQERFVKYTGRPSERLEKNRKIFSTERQEKKNSRRKKIQAGLKNGPGC